jgi:DNA-binding CsgD family transcriptional regulator
MNTFCVTTGLKIFSQPEWTNKNVSDTCANTFSILGNAILYSAPVGNFDLKGIRNSIQLKDEVKRYISEGKGPYFQILDYTALKGSVPAARKIFIKDLNDDKRLQALIFCNLSLPLLTAVKIGKQFNTTNKKIHIVNHYADAVKLALKLCDQFNLKQDFHTLDRSFCFDSSSYSRRQVELNLDNGWNVHAPKLSSRFAIIDRSILHSIAEGYLEYEHLSSIEESRHKCKASLPQGSNLDYIVIGTSGLTGMNRKARINYMKYMKEWHQRFPFRMYIIYGANRFMNTAVHMARPIMPFKIKIAQDFNQVLDIIKRDKLENSGKKQLWQKGEDSTEPADKNIEKLLAFIASLNWEQAGIESSFLVDEQHPFSILFQSIKLIKEEFDSLLNEQRELAASLQERELLLKKQTKELIVSNELFMNEIAIRKQAEAALKESHDKLEQSTFSLNEYNIALKVLLHQGEKDRKVIEDKMLHNVEKLIFPYLDKLKARMSEFEDKAYVEIIESNLKEIISPFGRGLSNSLAKLTPAEIQIADLIKHGKTTEEIAILLKLSPTTIATHRQNIRKKLVLTNKKMNLRAILATIQ